MSGKTILYVEDNEFNLKMVRQLLARTSYRLIEATDGEMGVATALRAAGPDPHGYPAAEAVRTGRYAQASHRSQDRRHPDHRDHLVRAQRRRREGEGCRRFGLYGKAV